jgi:hypothetical protein
MSNEILPLRANLTEAQFQTWVIGVARWNRWMVQHSRPAREASGAWSTPITGDPGFPDLVLAHKSFGTIFAELKTETGRVSPPQTAWIESLRLGSEAYVWRPSDAQFIARRLRGERGTI